MTTFPILYSFRRCPYAMRARMAVAVSGVPVELREVILRDKPPELLEVSPKATVPVLVLPDGCVLEESLDIMHWALEINDPEGWLTQIDHSLIAANDGPFKYLLDRYKYPNRYDLIDGIEHRDACLAHLAALNERLVISPYLVGKKRGFVDIALFPFVRQFAATNQLWFDAQPLPALQQWLSGAVQSELFAYVMARYRQWNARNPPTFFP